MTEESNQFDISGGSNLIAPNAMTQQQIFYGDQFARKILGSKEKPLTLVVLGAGVDATIGLPTSADLIPRIVDYLATDEGIKLDAILRKVIGRVHFHFDKFVSTAVDRLAKDLDKEIVSICHNINDELDNNKSLDETIPDDKFLEDYWENSRGGDNLYSVLWLYNRTGDKFLLDLAHKIHRNTANWTNPTSLPNWHNVNIAECFREPATYYMLTGDPKMLHASYNVQSLVRRTFGQVPGGMFGADENARMGYIDPRQGVECCGMVEQMASDEIMLRFTGDPAWADNCEDVAFNTFPASVMPDLDRKSVV